MHDRALIPKLPFRNDFFDVRSYFDVDVFSVDRERLDDMYIGGVDDRFDLKRYVAWKALRDPFYRMMVPRLKSFQSLYDAGFFVDTLEPHEVGVLDFRPGECRTPVSQVARNMSMLGTVSKPVVLLCTGAFSPIHNGHIGMMHKAREVLEKRGFQVVGGYFSPSHDAYVSEKQSGAAAFPSSHRVHLAQHAVAETGWLFVDPWESRYLPTDINFTEVVSRLESYINYYLKSRSPIRVVYVFGGDNASFSRVFSHKGLSVCVARGLSSQKQFNEAKRKNRNASTMFAHTDDVVAEVSSTVVRRWQTGLIPENITRTYLGWRLNMLRDTGGMEHSPKKLYILRDDRSWSLQPWTKRVTQDSLDKASTRFLRGFKVLLERSFRDVSLPDQPRSIELAVHTLKDQLAYRDAISVDEHVLNLDICTNEKQKGAIQISRAFSLCDGQVRPLCLVPRPGFADIEKQLRKLRAGQYTLLDDDISSGNTISMLLASLPERVQVNKVRTLTDYTHGLYLNRRKNALDLEVFDLVDLRDFIFGSRASGLVIQLPDNSTGRAPYSLPYISLSSRASIPPSTEMFFSKEIWRLNHSFFSSLSRELTIKDTDPYFQIFCRYLGFSKRMSMVDFCSWHIEHLLHYI